MIGPKRFPPKWLPVRRKKTRQFKNRERVSDSIKSDRALDTNVLVRFLVRDDERQFAKAQKLIKRESSAGETVLVSQLVLLEAEWVLRSRYALGKGDILHAFSGLLDSVELTIEDEPSVEQALFLWRSSSAEFADCLIGVRHLNLGCRATASFDARALKLPGFISA